MKFCGPIFDPLRFVKHHDVGLQTGVHVEGVADHLFVIDDGKKRRVLPVIREPADASAEYQLIRQWRESLDLFLPFRLERRRRDDEHASRLSEAVEEGARGNGLDRFAEAHLIGKQGAFAKGEMEHSFALIGKKRDPCFVRRPFAILDFYFISVPQGFALCRATPLLQPWLDILRNAQIPNIGGAQFFESSFRIIFNEQALFIEEPASRARTITARSQQSQRATGGIWNDDRPLHFALFRLSESAFCLFREMNQNGLDVFAGAERAGPEIHAIAGKLQAAHRPDLNGISAAACRFDAKIR